MSLLIDESDLLLHTLEEKYLPLRKQKEINFKIGVAVRKCLYKNRRQFALSWKCVDFKISYCAKCQIAAGWLFEGGIAYSCHSYPTVPNRKIWFGLLIIHVLCVERICINKVFWNFLWKERLNRFLQHWRRGEHGGITHIVIVYLLF